MEARAGNSILDFETLFSDFLELLDGSGLRFRQVCLSSEQTGVFLGETDTERFLDSAESVCCSVLQCQLKILVPQKKVGGRSWWNTRRNT